MKARWQKIAETMGHRWQKLLNILRIVTQSLHHDGSSILQ
jgi:hypothetical protein